MISVLILTLNEEANLGQCLASVDWSDDVVVLDSGSTDRTVEIAAAAGARIVTRTFDDERSQRTFAMRAIPFRHKWVYNPDADEVTPKELRDEMLSVVRDTDRPEHAWRVRFKNMFQGRWIRYSSLYPTWVVRLFRPEHITFERTINLRTVVDGPEGRLNSHFLHYSFEKGMDAWWEKHRRYAQKEAEETLSCLREGHIDWSHLFSGNPVARRRALKELSFRLPFRPLLRFVYMYFLRLGFLDGTAGLAYCTLLARYEGLIVRRIRELRRAGGMR